jgi:hypothetical protein
MRHHVTGVVLALAALSCSTKEGEIDGIGSWHIGKTKAAEAALWPRCQLQEDGLSWCANNPGMTIAEHPASVDLYFRGNEETSPLVEILVAMAQPCNTEALDKWLTHRLGAATGNQGRAMVWKGKATTVAALLPAKDGECRIHFLDPKDEARLGQLATE